MRNQNKHNLVRTLAAACLVAVLLVTASCKKKQPPPPAPANSGSIADLTARTDAPPAELKMAGNENVSIDGGGESYAHVTYNPGVKMVEGSDVDSSLLGITADGHEWIFQNAPASIRALQAGDVFMVKGQFAVKVLAVVTKDENTLVAVDQASMRDLVQSGEIKLDAPVSFHGPKQAANVEPPMPPGLFDRLIPPVYAAQLGKTAAESNSSQNAAAAKDAAQKAAEFLVSGWKIVNWTMTPGDGQANFNLLMVKNTDGFVAAISMKGWIANFDLTSNLIVDAAAPKRIARNIKKTAGNIQFDWEIALSKGGTWTTLDPVKLPAAISIPLAPLLSGMPLVLEISSALQIHPLLTGNNEFSRGGFNITWNGSKGSMSGESGADDSTDGSFDTATTVTADQSISPVAPNAMVVSFCAPRFELRLDAFGTYKKALKKFAAKLDLIAGGLELLLPSSVKGIISNSLMSTAKASTILSSNADIYIQFVTTEGVTHAANITPVPCSKQQIKIDLDAGTGVQFLGLTNGAKTSTNLYTRTTTRYIPDTPFCAGV